MADKRIVVLGGTGQVGRLLVRLLLERTDAKVVIAERRVEKAEALACNLRSRVSPERLQTAYADASRPDTLSRAFQGATLVIVTATVADFTCNVARACLDEDCDYLDILDAPEAAQALERLAARAEEAGRLLVTQGGLAPGTLATLAIWVRSSFDRFRAARFGIALSLKTTERYEKVYDVFEFVMKTRSLAFIRGKWTEVPPNQTARLYFGPRFGWRDAFPVDMLELHDLPSQLGLEEVSIYAASPNRMVDYLVRKLLALLHRIKPGFGWPTLAWLLFSMSKRMAREPSGYSDVLEAWGQKQGREVALRVMMDHEDNYLSTAFCVLAFVNQYFDRTFDGIAGLKMMAYLIDPERTFRELQSLGISISQKPIEQTAARDH